MSGQAEESITQYMTYLGKVIGLLSTAAFLPLSNGLLKYIPVYGEASLHTISASFFSTFFVWIIYSFRIDIAKFNQRSKQFISIITFISGFITFLDYRNLIFENPPMPDFGPRNRAFSEYCLMFGLWTMSFTLLAMSEYMHANPDLIRVYREKDAVIDDIFNNVTPDTKKNIAPKLENIIEEELENSYE